MPEALDPLLLDDRGFDPTVLAEAARLGEAALAAGDQADFGRLIDLAVQAGPAVTAGHADDDEPHATPSAAQ